MGHASQRNVSKRSPCWMLHARTPGGLPHTLHERW